MATSGDGLHEGLDWLAGAICTPASTGAAAGLPMQTGESGTTVASTGENYLGKAWKYFKALFIEQ